MKKWFIIVVCALFLTVSPCVSQEASAACGNGRLRGGVRVVVTAPFRLIRRMRQRAEERRADRRARMRGRSSSCHG